MACFRRGDLVEYRGERWTVYADEDPCGAADLCRTENYAQPLGARVAGVSASVLHLVRRAPDRTLGKGADIDYIEREDRNRRAARERLDLGLLGDVEASAARLRKAMAATASPEHVREGMSALDVNGGPKEVLVDCSCGWAGIMPSGGNEYERAEAVHAAHAERVRGGAAESAPTPAAQARIEEFYS